MPHISPDIEGRLKELVKVFLEENAKINLSAFRTEELCWVGNVMDSVAGVEIFGVESVETARVFPYPPSPCPPSSRLPFDKLRAGRTGAGARGDHFLDLGTGGGFPLLPLAICLPHCRFTGVDSVQKKISVVERIAKAMDLKNVSLLCGRAEELGRDPLYREQYDVVTCRGVANIAVLIEYGAPLLKVGGSLLLWKSMTIDQELKDSLFARTELSCHLKETHPYELPDNFGKRQILVFRKAAKTAPKYPRAVGVAKKEPLV